MIINDLGINFAGGGGGGTGSTAVLTSATFSANSAYTPAHGVDGWSAVTVNVDETPAYNSGYTEGSEAGFASGETVGYASGTTDGAAAQKALLSSTSITENGEYTSENGFSAVTVNVSGSEENRLNKLIRDNVTAITENDLSGVTTVPPYSFFRKTNIKTITFSTDNYGLGEACCSSNAGLETVNFTPYLQSNYTYQIFGDAIFSGCTSLNKLNNFELLTGSFGSNFFRGCSSLTEIVTFMDNSAGMGKFSGCTNLKSITYLKHQDYAGQNSSQEYSTYIGCSSLVYLDFTHNTSVAAMRASGSLSGISSTCQIRVPSSLYDTWKTTGYWTGSSIVDRIVPVINPEQKFIYTTSDGNVLTHWSGTTSTTCQTGYQWYVDQSEFVEQSEYNEARGYADFTLRNKLCVSDNIFAWKNTLTSVKIAEGVIIIGSDAFRASTSLTTVELPSTVKLLGDNVFSGTAINSITCRANTAPFVRTNTFKNIPETGTLYVPAGSDYTTWSSKLPSGWTVQNIADTDWSTEYLQFKIVDANPEGKSIVYKPNTGATQNNFTAPIQYSINGGTWTTIGDEVGTTYTIDNLSNGDVIRFKGLNPTYCLDKNAEWGFSGSSIGFDVKGNIMSLIYGDNFSGQTAMTSAWTFYQLFASTELLSSKDLVLPSIELTESCYRSMFGNSTSMTETMDVLPATIGANTCYAYMYNNTRIKTAPVISISDVSQLTSACTNMFASCSALIRATSLTQGTLGNNYAYFINGTQAFKNLYVLNGTQIPKPTSAFWINMA